MTGFVPGDAFLASTLSEEAQQAFREVLARFRCGGDAYARHGLRFDDLNEVVEALRGIADVYDALLPR